MKKIFILIVLSFIGIHTFSQESLQFIYKGDNGNIKFTSEAPLEIITAQSDELKGIIDLEKQTFAFQLNIESLAGFNSPLQQEHFYENYMETEKHPQASFYGKLIEKTTPDRNGTYEIRAKGILEIHGIKQERIIESILIIDDDVVRISSAFNILLIDHAISIPKLVYQKIAEEIKVEVKAELKKINTR